METGAMDPEPDPISSNLCRGAAHIGGEDDTAPVPMTTADLRNAGSEAWMLDRSVLYVTMTAGRHDNTTCPYAVLEVDGARIASFVSGQVSADAVAALSALGFGAACRTPADTLICAYVQWGEHFVDRLGDGCACVIWDDRRSRLMLTRGADSDTTIYVDRRRCRVDYWATGPDTLTPEQNDGRGDGQSVASGPTRSPNVIERGALLVLE